MAPSMGGIERLDPVPKTRAELTFSGRSLVFTYLHDDAVGLGDDLGQFLIRTLQALKAPTDRLGKRAKLRILHRRRDDREGSRSGRA